MSPAGVALWMTFAVFVDRVVVHRERVMELVGRVVEGRHDRQISRCVSRHPAKPFSTIDHVRVVRGNPDPYAPQVPPYDASLLDGER